MFNNDKIYISIIEYYVGKNDQKNQIMFEI